MAELPNIVNFDAAASTVPDEDLAEVAGIGSDPQAHVDAIMSFVEAGYDEVCVQVGDDKDGFFRFWTEELGAAAHQGRRVMTARAVPATVACTTTGDTAGLDLTRTWLSW